MAAREPLIDTELVAEFAEQPPVDKTPISPVGPARRDSIEQHLLHRPERDNLVESASPSPAPTDISPSSHAPSPEN